MDAFRLTNYQQEILAAPEDCNIFLPGGRGSGKSYGMLGLAIQHEQLHGEHARIAYIRRHRPDCRDFESAARTLFWQAYGEAATYNAATGIWRFPSGATLEIGNLETESDLNRWTGRSFTLLLLDEVQQHPAPAILDRLRACLRSGANVPVRAVMAANPSGAGHSWLVRRFGNATPRKPFQDDAGNWWISFPGTYLQNDALHQENYARELRAACAGDENLLLAWLDGRWDVLAGSFFMGSLDPDRVAVDWPTRRGNLKWWMTQKWRKWIAMDWGSSAPCVAYLIAESPGDEGPDGKWYPRRSLIAIDEFHTARPDDLATGLGLTVPEVAARIRDMCQRWGADPSGVADPSIFAKVRGRTANSIADEFRAAGVHFSKGDNNRASGWQKMRTLFNQAGEPDEPGLFVDRRCEYFWQTALDAPRSKRDPEDLDTSCIDHGLDAMRYGCMHSGGSGSFAMSTVPFFGR